MLNEYEICDTSSLSLDLCIYFKSNVISYKSTLNNFRVSFKFKVLQIIKTIPEMEYYPI